MKPRTDVPVIGFFDALRRLNLLLPPAGAWTVVALLTALFLFLAAVNASLWWNNYVRKKATASVTPLIGGFAGYVAMRVSPLPALTRYAWLAPLMDVGCVPFLIQALLGAIRRSGPP